MSSSCSCSPGTRIRPPCRRRRNAGRRCRRSSRLECPTSKSRRIRLPRERRPRGNAVRTSCSCWPGTRIRPACRRRRNAGRRSRKRCRPDQTTSRSRRNRLQKGRRRRGKTDRSSCSCSPETRVRQRYRRRQSAGRRSRRRSRPVRSTSRSRRSRLPRERQRKGMPGCSWCRCSQGTRNRPSCRRRRSVGRRSRYWNRPARTNARSRRNRLPRERRQRGTTGRSWCSCLPEARTPAPTRPAGRRSGRERR